jgi:hypothetical protein
MRRNARLLAVAAATAAVLAALPARAARAGYEYYCTAAWVPAGQTCRGDRHSLRQNHAANWYSDTTKSVGAAAKDLNFNMYGSWVYGYGNVCHSYSGDNLLYPYITAAQVSQTMGGLQFYGSEPSC